MKEKLKTYFILLAYAFCFVQIWGICFISSQSANELTCGFALAFSFVSSYFIQKDFDFKLDIWQKLFFILLMMGYSSNFINGDWILFLFSPLFLGVLFIVLNFFVFKDLRKFRNCIFFVTIIITYLGWNYFPVWQKERLGYVDEKSIIINDSEEKTIEKRQEAPDDYIDISSFSFLDLNLDTVNIRSDKPYIFIETWNEKCPPCKRAIKELTPILDTMKNKMDSYFIYENHKFDKNVFVSSTKKVKGLFNQKVLADPNQEFYKSMNMVAYPTFLIIDNKKGEIIYMSVGFGGSGGKKKLIGKLREISKDK